MSCWPPQPPKGHWSVDPEAHQCGVPVLSHILIVRGVWFPCPVPRILLCLGLYGFSGLHALFMPVETGKWDFSLWVSSLAKVKKNSESDELK